MSNDPRAAPFLKIDDTHANPRALWQAMGSPPVASITPAQIQALKNASLVVPTKLAAASVGGVVELNVTMLPNSAVVLGFSSVWMP
jgi:hypothetical protein